MPKQADPKLASSTATPNSQSPPPCPHCGGATAKHCALGGGLIQYRCEVKSCRKFCIPCPRCGGAIAENQTISSGLIQYRCKVKSCGKCVTPGAKLGRPKAEKPLTPTERSKASRDRQSPEQRAIAIEKNRLRRKAKRDAERILRDGIDATKKMSI